MSKIKYIQLEPSAFLTDIDFQMMNAEQRGVYCSVIFYLYCNQGKIDLTPLSSITLLSNNTTRLAIISGCEKIGAEWDLIWSKIADKFQICDNILTHKRVSEELDRAENFIKTKSEAGKAGMLSRWGDNIDITKGSKVKVKKEKKEYSPKSEAYKLASLLHRTILKRKPDLKKPNPQIWSRHIDLMIRLDKRSPKIIEQVIKFCQADPFWQNNILSTEKLRKQYDRLTLLMESNQGTGNSNPLCVVDKNQGYKYQSNNKNQKVYLCEECLINFNKSGCKGWGKLPLREIEKKVLEGKAKR